MNSPLLRLALAFAVLSIGLARSSAAASDPYDFKGDQLGMSLQDFQTKHHDPGHSELRNKCNDRGACTPESIWVPDTTCKEEAKNIVSCYSRTTIADNGANANFLFVDSKLAAISVSFTYLESQLPILSQALSEKFGSPFATLNGKVGNVFGWQNASSIAVLQEHLCQNGPAMVQDRLAMWATDVADAMSTHYCATEDVLSYNYSRLLYVDKTSAALVQTRIHEAREAVAATAKKDI